MRLNAIVLSAFSLFFLTNCTSIMGDSHGPVGLNYQPRILTTKKKSTSKSACSIIQIGGDQSASTFNSVKAQGKVLFGESRFKSAFNNYNIEAKNQAMQIGADSVVISMRKSGKAKGDRMVVIAKTDPTVGLTTTNLFGSIASSTVTPYGNVYGNSNYSGTGFSTNYNPGQTLYTRQDYVYDEYEYVFSFFGNP